MRQHLPQTHGNTIDPKLSGLSVIQEVDAFVPTAEYSKLAQQLGLVEWNPVVWIGRLFALNNDYGEHWFDNWDEREARSEAASKLGFESQDLLIVLPDRFKNDDGGPCNPPDLRKQFWTDVLKSRLERIYRLASETGQLARFIVFGSFITTKLEPNDLDVFLFMEDTFDVSQLSGEARLLFEHAAAQAHFGASIFWIRRLAALNGEQATIEHWQIKRDGNQRGIVEIISE